MCRICKIRGLYLETMLVNEWQAWGKIILNEMSGFCTNTKAECHEYLRLRGAYDDSAKS